MRTFPTLIALLATTLSIAACGASEPQQAERAAPSQEKQAAPATQRDAKENAPRESVPEESASQESARGDEGGEAAGLRVTTLEGERVSLGGQGDVTALYFMAGW